MRLRYYAIGGCLLAICSAGMLSNAADNPPTSGLEKIMSPDNKEREQGQRVIFEDRARVIQSLLAIIKSPYKDRVDHWIEHSPRNTAIRCIGEYRAVEAIPDLLHFLGPEPGESVTTDTVLSLCPAADALVRIGSPCVPALIHLLATMGIDGNLAAWQARFAIHDIEGKQRGGQILQDAAAAEKDPAKAANLQAQLSEFEKEFRR